MRCDLAAGPTHRLSLQVLQVQRQAGGHSRQSPPPLLLTATARRRRCHWPRWLLPVMLTALLGQLCRLQRRLLLQVRRRKRKRQHIR